MLLVEDDNLFASAVVRLLEDTYSSIVVLGATVSGKEILAIAAAIRPDVILIDLHMPRANGLDVIPRLRSLLPHVGIIVLTGLDDAETRQRALAADADEFVPKTAAATDLLPAMRRVTARHRAQDAGPPAQG